MPASDASKSSNKLLRRLLGFARRPTIQGFVDRVVAGEVHGWAFDPNRPDRRLLIVATLDGAVQAETLADLPRKDLEAAGKGDGRHGFRLRLPAALSAQSPARLQIQVMIGSQRHPLQRGAVELPPTREPGTVEPLIEPRMVTAGFLESFRGGVVRGWAVDPNHPDAPALVDVYDGEIYLGSAQADTERPRLQRSGAPQGARGFTFSAPARRDLGDGDGVRARVAGTRFDLRRSRTYPGTGGAAGHREDDGDAGEAGRDEAASPLAARPLPPEPSGVLTLSLPLSDADAGDAAALRARIAGAELTALLPPGWRAHPTMAATLEAAPRWADVLVWSDSEEKGLPAANPRLDERLGRNGHAPLALRSVALLAYPGDLAADLATPNADAVRRWAALTAGLRWLRLPDGLSERPEAGSVTTTAVPRTRPAIWSRRITLAAWSGWTDGPPPAIRALLAGAEGLQVEVLAPASPAAKAWEAALTEDASAVGAMLTLRQLDGWADSDAARLRAMAAAASGEVLVFCEGSARLQTSALPRVLGWALASDVGAVTVALADGETSVAGLELQSPEGDVVALAPDGVRVAHAAPPQFMAISRTALRQVGGFVAVDEATADVDLGLRLRERGLSTVVLGDLRATLDAGRLAGLQRRPATSTSQARSRPGKIAGARPDQRPLAAE